MKTAAERLKFAREKYGGFERPIDATRKFKWNYNTYKSTENGSKALTWKKAVKYGESFGVDPKWLYFGEDFAIGLAHTDVKLIKLDGINKKDDLERLMETTREQIRIHRKFERPEDIFAVENEDDAMTANAGAKPSFERGDILTFDRNEPIKAGDFVLAYIGEINKTLFRQYRDRGISEDGAHIIELAPLNQSHRSYQIIDGVNGEVIARLVKRAVIEDF